MNEFVDVIGCWAAGIGIVWGRYSSFGWIGFVFVGIIGAGKFGGIFGLGKGCQREPRITRGIFAAKVNEFLVEDRIETKYPPKNELDFQKFNTCQIFHFFLFSWTP